MRARSALVVGGLALVLVAGGSAGLAARSGRTDTAGPSARVGAIYFDGWACPLSNFHFNGLLKGPYSTRRPLSGWRDDSLDALRAQLRWAHADGIGFFLFDWYREGVDPCLNVAHDNYLRLHDHAGVGFALLYVNHDPFGVPPAAWPALAEQWVTRDFLSPGYERVGGKPLLVIFDTTLFRQQQGGTAGVNAALAALRDAARRHGLPGVFVVGGRYTDYLNADCFPECDATDGGPDGLPKETYDALTEYAYTGAVAPVDGPRSYAEFAAAKELNWEQFAQKSPVPYVPSVMDGWDPRPWNERPYGHLFWLDRTPKAVGGFLGDAVSWVGSHPRMQVEPAGSPPLVLLEAWNELGEGGYVLPTDGDGFSYGRALAQALGLAWAPPPRRGILVRTSRAGTVKGSRLGVSCPPKCRVSVANGQLVAFTARPRRGYAFGGWRGACGPASRTCSFIVLRNSTVRALFRKRR
jgi:hypothetical protein